MDAFVVRPAGPLSGRVRVNGAKNSSLKLVAAALLAEGRSVVRNVPDIADMRVMAGVLAHLGADVDHDGDAWSVDVPAVVGTATPPALAARLRASICVLGPLLARCGRARAALPGGDRIGSRNIDMHLGGLERMGATVEFGPDFVEARADRLVGADIDLEFASVGATENLLMAAVRAAGTTTIANAAREPEVADLAAFLNAMGADVRGAGTPTVEVRGVGELRPATHQVVPDRIEAGTFAVAAAVSDGEVELEGVVPGHLRLALDKLRAAGIEAEAGDTTLTVRGRGALRGVDVVTLPYPGFPTDLQPQFLVLLSQAAGTSMVTENVFDGRFSAVAELARMGADAYVEGHHIIVRGRRRLRGATVRATDVRAGAALVLAGLVADGPTVVLDPHHVDRGYADFAGRLRALGADIERRGVPARAGAA
ncbi:MAG: UDP-N-acetylglucosamine 1-carboxyvinyltransferase [Actinobacteria bacterium]|nr:UDP-N-acetylglucosamine 1-carboxyvinyltransferase [Actinomycetota bacterium]